MLSTFPIYLVSLEQDVQRREALKKHFPKYYPYFKHVESIDGRKLIAKEYFDKTLPYYLNTKKVMSPAELGCTLSHIEALNAFLLTDEQYALILEDDVIGTDKDLEVVYDLAKKMERDSLLLCGAQEGLSRKHQLGRWIDSKAVYEVSKLSYTFIFRTCCYVVTRKSAQQIIDSHEESLTLADKWSHFFEKNKTKIYYINALHHPEDFALSHIEAERAILKRKTFLQKVLSPDAPIKIVRKIKNEAHRLVLLSLGAKQLP